MTRETFRSALLMWYASNKRDLPWRKTCDPYFIWVSEVILQQTRVSQGLAYYKRFIRQYPDVRTLASSSSDALMKIWEGLGYYRRARNMRTAAIRVMEDFQGKVPFRYEELLTLKGIGPYTAAAIASIAGGEPVAVVDGNVYRVLSRMFGITAPKSSSTGQKQVNKLAARMIDPRRPGDYNQAIMELGALICTPRNPSCETCPFTGYCYARAHGLVKQLPVREIKPKVPVRYFHYFILSYHDRLIIRQRTRKGIWHLLYDFPLIERAEEISIKNLLNSGVPEQFPGMNPYPDRISGIISHKLTHLHIRARFYHFDLRHPDQPLPENHLLISRKEIKKYPFPQMIVKYLNEISLNNHR
ncbi:MAG: A/G-specific adenine glycosylase [Chlorobi bacterium]|nr:A/G-specific adenine glycosylase [Chlorobiota bacterium]